VYTTSTLRKQLKNIALEILRQYAKQTDPVLRKLEKEQELPRAIWLFLVAHCGSEEQLHDTMHKLRERHSPRHTDCA
jgi:hypothetical protein